MVLGMEARALSMVSKWSTILVFTALLRWGDTMSKQLLEERNWGLLTDSDGELMTIMTWSMAASRPGPGKVTDRLQVVNSFEADRHWSWSWLLKPQSPTRSDTAPPTNPHHLTFPKQFHLLRTKLSNIWTIGVHSHSNHHNHIPSLMITSIKLTSFFLDCISLFLFSIYLYSIYIYSTFPS